MHNSQCSLDKAIEQNSHNRKDKRLNAYVSAVWLKWRFRNNRCAF